jgi:hypothetical protein
MIKALAGFILALGMVSPALATMQPAPLHVDRDTLVTPAAQGCGANRYRGPGGACHWYGRGPYPGGYYGRRYYAGPRYYGRHCWRGPYGAWHCN